MSLSDEVLDAIERAAYVGDLHRDPETDVRVLLAEVRDLRDQRDLWKRAADRAHRHAARMLDEFDARTAEIEAERDRLRDGIRDTIRYGYCCDECYENGKSPFEEWQYKLFEPLGESWLGRALLDDGKDR